jgi:nitrous oxide reductase accessory protein NosL
MSKARRRRWAEGALLVLFVAALAGCRARSGETPPAVSLGKAVCETCGMTVTDARFAALAEEGGTLHTYDSIECLLRARRMSGAGLSGAIWLTDFDTRTLHPQSGVTVVRADYPSPMSAGYAAFADTAKARSEALARHGQMGSLAEALNGALERGRP